MSDVLEREPQSVCGFTGDDYWQVLADLRPPGIAWPTDPDTVQMQTLRGLAEEYARFHERDCDLLAEAYPPTATETIPDWMRVCGLPDECTGPIETLQEQREAVMAKLAARGGQSRQYFIDLAAALGYEITITEFRPMLASQCRAGDSCYHQSIGRPATLESRMNDWWFVWQVRAADDEKVVYFRASESIAGQPLVKWGNDMLECALLAAKPAHTHINFAYGPPNSVVRAIWDSGNSIWDGGDSLWEDRL
jgi:uncharacterized protein YmfQ (DUF2313 family)